MKSQRFRILTREGLEARWAQSVNGGVIISEVMYHPSVSAPDEAAGFDEDDFEFIELQNVGSLPVDLAGMELAEGVTFRAGPYVLAPGEHALIVKNATAMTHRYGDQLPVLGEFKGTLSNGRERLMLLDRLGDVVLDFEYQDDWHPSTDGHGYSLTVADALADAAAWEGPAGWQASQQWGGSPGVADGESGHDPNAIPRELTALAMSSRHVDLNWASPSAPLPVSEYRIYRNGTLLSTSTTTSFRDATAGPNQTWQYRVSAVNVLGAESGKSIAAVATIEPLGGETQFAAGENLGVLDSIGNNELSGAAASRVNADVLWVNNDGAGSNAIYAINTHGEFLAEVVLDAVWPIDWEDIAVGPATPERSSHVFVGDIGDNQADRMSITVFRFLEPTLSVGDLGESIVISPEGYRVFELEYPDGPHDAEVLMVDPLTGDLFVVAKEPTVSRVYRASAAAMAVDDLIELEFVASVTFHEPSAGDLAPDGSEIILRNEDQAIVFRRDSGQSVAEALSGRPTDAPVIGRPEELNGEAIAYDAENRGYYTVSEGAGQSLYFFARVGPSRPGDANHDGRFDSSDLVLVFQQGRYTTEQPALWSQGDWNGDGFFDSSDLVAAFQVGDYESDTRRAQRAVE